MMTTNKLTKTFASGSLAIGVLAGAVLTATSASAVTLTWEAWTGTPTTPGTPLEVGDKIVKFVSENNSGAEAMDEVMLMEMGDHYYFVYDAMKGSSGANTSGGSFTYTIEITEPDWIFQGVDLDSNVSSNYGDVTEKFAEIPGLSLVSTNGLPVPTNGFIGVGDMKLKLLTVTNTLTDPMSSTEGLFQFQNSFHQKYIPPVPEPGTILGLLAVGGLGLVSRFKKQK